LRFVAIIVGKEKAKLKGERKNASERAKSEGNEVRDWRGKGARRFGN